MLSVEDDLYQSAITFIKERYPTGWGGAAAIRLRSGDILTSVAPDTDFDALAACMELGAILEAHKLDEAVTHSICVFRDGEHSRFKILSPCGICQERLRHWGSDVMVAISNPEQKVMFKPLLALQPHHWRTAIDQSNT